MATDKSVVDERGEQVQYESQLRNGALLMTLAGIAFVGYGIVFLVLNFVGGGFELGVNTLAGMTATDLDPTVAYYISHLHVATAAFIISTGIAVAGLSWYGVRQRFVTGVIADSDSRSLTRGRVRRSIDHCPESESSRVAPTADRT
jgi:hypothetical protein